MSWSALWVATISTLWAAVPTARVTTVATPPRTSRQNLDSNAFMISTLRLFAVHALSRKIRADLATLACRAHFINVRDVVLVCSFCDCAIHNKEGVYASQTGCVSILESNDRD